MSVIRRYPRVAAVTAVMLLVAAAALAAQTMKLDDGTYATKVVTYTKAGVEASSASNAAASAVGAATPSSASYTGVNLFGFLQGWTASNPSGSIVAGDINIAGLNSATPSATNPFPARFADSAGYIADDVAEGAASSGKPVPVGTLVETSNAGITLLDDADRGFLAADADRTLYVRPYGSLADLVQERTTNTDGASTAFASGLAAAGAGVRIYLTSCTLANSSASFATVDLRDGAAGSVLWTIPVPATGGAVESFGGSPLKFTANTAVAFDASAATTTLTISCKGFKSKAG